MKKIIKSQKILLCCLLMCALIFGVTVVKADEETISDEDLLVINSDSSYGDIKILKKDVDTDKPISGVKFKLLASNQKEAKDQDGAVVSDVVTDSNGVATFKNVAYGTYYIKEVSTPNGYKSKEAPIKFILSKATDAVILSGSGNLNYRMGDINNDGEVNQADLERLTAILSDEKAVLELDKLTKFVSDLNGDGVLNTTDSAILNAYLNGSSTAVRSSGTNLNSLKNKICQALAGTTDCDVNSLHIDKLYQMYTRMTEYENVLSTYGSYNEQGLFIGNEGLPINNPICTETDTTYKFKLGDINGDCTIDNNDLTELQSLASSATPTEDELRIAAGDLNGDGELTTADATILNAYLSNKSNTELINSIISYINGEASTPSTGDDINEYVLKVGTTGVMPQDISQASVLITNEKIKIKISMLDSKTKKYLSGVKLVIKNSKGTIIKNYVTGSTYIVFDIAAGTYSVTELDAPDGYTKLQGSIDIRVYNDGSIKLLTTGSNMYKITNFSSDDSTLNHLVLHNAEAPSMIKIPDTASNVQIIAIATGLALIIGGGYIIYRKYGKVKA